jgi:hypothetical protein
MELLWRRGKQRRRISVSSEGNKVFCQRSDYANRMKKTTSSHLRQVFLWLPISMIVDYKKHVVETFCCYRKAKERMWAYVVANVRLNIYTLSLCTV